METAREAQKDAEFTCVDCDATFYRLYGEGAEMRQPWYKIRQPWYDIGPFVGYLLAVIMVVILGIALVWFVLLLFG